jgi:hypothetical protein
MKNDFSTLNPKEAIEYARHIASLFDIPKPLEATDFEGKGNINQETFLIKAGKPPHSVEYLLQKINPDVFKRPRLVMQSMIACIEAQRNALLSNRNPYEWETIQLIRTRKGEDWLEMAEGEDNAYWRLMVRMSHTHSYKSLWDLKDTDERLRVAEETAKGLALFGNLTAAMPTAGLVASLPGYRDTQLYYDQLQSLRHENRTLDQAADFLPSDPLTRQCTEQHFLVYLDSNEYRSRMADPQVRCLIGIALEQKDFALSLVNGLKSGKLSLSVIHGDTKLENFLFNSQTGNVKSLIDLDTVMPHTWLSDWGDMARSLANAAGEKESDMQKIDVDLEVFRAMARGFLGSARSVHADEVRLMTEAAQVMSLELGVRFLADYIRGDSYFKLRPSDPRDLNKTRALVQFAIFEKFRAIADTAKKYIQDFI